MTSTALGAETKKEEKIIFISDAHEKFYYEKLKEVRYQDVYHKALCYCLGISDDTRRNVYRIYDFKTGCVITECLHDLIGKTAIAIVNLPPRKMMGIDSEGMLISAVHEEDGHEGLNLLMVNDRIPAGAKLY